MISLFKRSESYMLNSIRILSWTSSRWIKIVTPSSRNQASFLSIRSLNYFNPAVNKASMNVSERSFSRIVDKSDSSLKKLVKLINQSKLKEKLDMNKLTIDGIYTFRDLQLIAKVLDVPRRVSRNELEKNLLARYKIISKYPILLDFEDVMSLKLEEQLAGLEFFNQAQLRKIAKEHKIRLAGSKDEISLKLKPILRQAVKDGEIGQIRRDLMNLPFREAQKKVKQYNLTIKKKSDLEKVLFSHIIKHENKTKTQKEQIYDTLETAAKIKNYKTSILNKRENSLFSENFTNLTMERVISIIEKFKNSEKIPKSFIMKLLKHSIKTVEKLPNIIEISRKKTENGVILPFTIVGDTHGQFDDFLKIFENNIGGFPSDENRFLFIGDMVNRGGKGMEVVLTQLLLKLLKPNSIFMIRGNHFENRMLKNQDEEILRKFQEFFSNLPIGAVLENSVFITHSGLISPTVFDCTIEELNKFNRKLIDFEKNDPFYDTIWSDPGDFGEDDKLFSHVLGQVGGGIFFNKEATKYFLSKNKLDLIVRSYHDVKDGFAFNHDNKCITVFSAPNYNKRKNKAAIIRFEGQLNENKKVDMTPTIIQFTEATKKINSKKKMLQFGTNNVTFFVDSEENFSS